MRAVFGGVRRGERRAGFEKCAGFDGEEDGAEAHGAEVAGEERFAVGVNVWDEALEGEHDGDAAEEEDERQED